MFSLDIRTVQISVDVSKLFCHLYFDFEPTSTNQSTSHSNGGSTSTRGVQHAISNVNALSVLRIESAEDANRLQAIDARSSVVHVEK